MSSFILIDGKNALYRHAAVHSFLTAENGFPTGALYGCLSSMLSLHRHIPDAGIIWCWDGAGDTWRHTFMRSLPKFPVVEKPKPVKVEKLYGYKANRHRNDVPIKKPKKDEPVWPQEGAQRALIQIPVLKMILEGCGIRSFEVDGLECDDLLAMIATRILELDKNSKVYIHSGDKDYYQLLVHKNIQIIKNMKGGKLVKVKAKHVKKEFGVKPKNWAKYESLTGGHNGVTHYNKIGGMKAKKMLAAKIDPSKVLPPKLTPEFEKFFDLITLDTLWPTFHGNYKLCKLVVSPDDNLLSEEVRGKLVPMFEKLDSLRRFYRSSKGKTPQAYRKVGLVLAKYDLSSIHGSMNQLFSIP